MSLQVCIWVSISAAALKQIASESRELIAAYKLWVYILIVENNKIHLIFFFNSKK